jgi:hypothetical protein
VEAAEAARRGGGRTFELARGEGVERQHRVRQRHLDAARRLVADGAGPPGLGLPPLCPHAPQRARAGGSRHARSVGPVPGRRGPAGVPSRWGRGGRMARASRRCATVFGESIRETAGSAQAADRTARRCAAGRKEGRPRSGRAYRLVRQPYGYRGGRDARFRLRGHYSFERCRSALPKTALHAAIAECHGRAVHAVNNASASACDERRLCSAAPPCAPPCAPHRTAPRSCTQSVGRRSRCSSAGRTPKRRTSRSGCLTFSTTAR